jgi:hypothetical protein
MDGSMRGRRAGYGGSGRDRHWLAWNQHGENRRRDIG